jgi:hypothetical protein
VQCVNNRDIGLRIKKEERRIKKGMRESKVVSINKVQAEADPLLVVVFLIVYLVTRDPGRCAPVGYRSSSNRKCSGLICTHQRITISDISAMFCLLTLSCL